MSIQWKGVIPALTTKFTSDDQLDLPLFEKNLNEQLDAGVNGVILGGTLGEASVLTTEEKEILVKFAIQKVAGKVPVIINIAEGSTREAIQQSTRCLEYCRRQYQRSIATGSICKRMGRRGIDDLTTHAL